MFVSLRCHSSLTTVVATLTGIKEFNALTVMHDFEDAMINVFGKMLPCKHHKGCYFHLLKAWREKLVELNVEEDLQKAVMSILRFMTVVPIEQMDMAFDYVMMKSKKFDGARRQSKQLNEFFRYFEKQWMTDRLKKFWNYSGVEGWETDM